MGEIIKEGGKFGGYVLVNKSITALLFYVGAKLGPSLQWKYSGYV
jgi:hypothetical protein